METLCLNSLYMAIKLKLIFSVHEEKKYKYKKIKMTPHSTLPTTEQTKKEIAAFWKSVGIVLHLGKTSPHYHLLTDFKYFSKYRFTYKPVLPRNRPELWK